MMRIGICDALPFSVEAISKGIADWAEQHHILVCMEKFISGEEVLFDLEAQGDFGAVFLGTELDGISGMETALRLREKDRLVSIVFLSPCRRYQREMFKIYPFQFLEKPIAESKVFEALDLIVAEQRLLHEGFAFWYNRTAFHIDLRQVLYFASERRVIRVFMEDGGEYVFYEKLDRLEEMLVEYPHYFIRIHQSFLINIRQIRQHRFNTIVMRNGDVLTVSSRQKMTFNNAVCYMRCKIEKKDL